jgi:hypothetical protein
MAAGFQYRDSLDACFDQGFLDSVQLGGLDDGFNLEHCWFLALDLDFGVTV